MVPTGVLSAAQIPTVNGRKSSVQVCRVACIRETVFVYTP